MIGFVITLLLVIALLAALAVLVPSVKQAWLAHRGLKQALSLCRDERLVTVRMIEGAKRMPQPRRHVRTAMRAMQPVRTGALRAAA